jgi:hypothetical protein
VTKDQNHRETLGYRQDPRQKWDMLLFFHQPMGRPPYEAIPEIAQETSLRKCRSSHRLGSVGRIAGGHPAPPFTRSSGAASARLYQPYLEAAHLSIIYDILVMYIIMYNMQAIWYHEQ